MSELLEAGGNYELFEKGLVKRFKAEPQQAAFNFS